MADIVFRAFYLGTTNYAKTLQLQRNLIKWMIDQRELSIPTLLLLQHEPVYTVGYRNKQYTVDEQLRLERIGADFVRTNRGGLITFHGPGQLVAYPIFSMRKVPISIRNYLCKLEQLSIDICSKYGLEATRTSDTGVWIQDRKICAIGVNAQQRVFSHGIALNCNTDLSWFSHIVPCGLKDKGVTSLSLETGNEVTVEQVLPLFIETFVQNFGWQLAELKPFKISDTMNDEVIFKSLSGS